MPSLVLNYLAHLFLAENNAASRIGNLLGDFVTGRPEEIQLPPEIVAGIIRHRTIDRLTDDHPAVIAARDLFTDERRRFSNAILDICFDHFLANSWSQLHPLPLRDFLDQSYDDLRTHRKWLPASLSDTLDERIADDWLGHYATETGLQKVFNRVAERRPACAAVATAMIDFRANREVFESVFHTLIPDLRAQLVDLGPERLAVEAL
ncbi:ACP phosphodiesterase [Haloferula chungangensis]|uniref:ACP phosphodiesterase n=1 Tax=Haloferula chungangensis TaxID=1048331 RepID=A0ABW2L5I6_9BACT